MLTDNELDRLRLDQEDWLPDRCTLEKYVEPEWDDKTGTYQGGWEPYATDQECRIASLSNSTIDRVAVFGEESVSLEIHTLTLPWNRADLRREHRVTITQSEDPSLVGSKFLVRSVSSNSYHTARRVIVERLVTSEEEEES